jgi:hypothetical protein
MYPVQYNTVRFDRDRSQKQNVPDDLRYERCSLARYGPACKTKTINDGAAAGPRLRRLRAHSCRRLGRVTSHELNQIRDAFASE